ncbi:MAG TPA: DUF1963 domain-containing protein [Solirubrobacteraceae bacterium]|nr:DUF1963 domain-containing protein [Solirubrobacteraceae bacterium]
MRLDDVLAIADECGLNRRLDDVRALARRSLRLTLVGEASQGVPRASWLGDPALRPVELAWSGQQEPHCLAGIDLAQAVVVLGDDGPLPSEGTLWCFAPPAASFLSGHGDPTDHYVVIHPGDAMPAAATISLEAAAQRSARSIELSPELQLPRVWSDCVQALGLDQAEHDGWQRLRQQLAERQGVQVHDMTQGFQVMHRLLGYPDTRRGDMPLACELLDRGYVLGETPPLAHPCAADAEPHAGRWRLLLQLSMDDALGWFWGGGRERLYVWIDESDLTNGDFSRVRAIAQ